MALEWESVRKGKSSARISKWGTFKKIIRTELSVALYDRVEPNIKKLHEEITQDWEQQEKFKKERKETPDLETYVSPKQLGKKAKIYGYVDQGTPAHTISGNLSFKTGYSPKTAPNPGRSTGGGGESSGPRVYAKTVNHPGIEARRFSVEIGDTILPFFIVVTEGAMVRIDKAVNNE